MLKCLQNSFWYMSKNDAINIINGSNLVDKSSVLYKKNIFGIYKNEWEYWLN